MPEGEWDDGEGGKRAKQERRRERRRSTNSHVGVLAEPEGCRRLCLRWCPMWRRDGGRNALFMRDLGDLDDLDENGVRAEALNNYGKPRYDVVRVPRNVEMSPG